MSILVIDPGAPAVPEGVRVVAAPPPGATAETIVLAIKPQQLDVGRADPGRCAWRQPDRIDPGRRRGSGVAVAVRRCRRRQGDAQPARCDRQGRRGPSYDKRCRRYSRPRRIAGGAARSGRMDCRRGAVRRGYRAVGVRPGLRVPLHRCAGRGRSRAGPARRSGRPAGARDRRGGGDHGGDGARQPGGARRSRRQPRRLDARRAECARSRRRAEEPAPRNAGGLRPAQCRDGGGGAADDIQEAQRTSSPSGED